ncbi:MAG: vWA domain-containing protein, partial [Pseudomonadota bacterium]
MRVSTWLTGALWGGALLLGVQPVRAADTVIVYDASNSMWGRIEGEAKVSIARRVMADLVRDWDDDTNIGLVAYGHRRAGDCTDIETVSPVGPVDRDALVERVRSIQPNGKTPLTAAVRHAAETLRYRDNPSNVILISDGIESCNADPCAMSEELNRAGIRFTAHVVGFDVDQGADRKQLRCIADNTGGRFFTARDAAGLETALAEAAEIAAEPEPPAPEVTLDVPERAVAGSRVRISWSAENQHRRDLVTIVPAEAPADVRDDYARTKSESAATIVAPGEPGAYEARYVSSATGGVVVRAPIRLTEPKARVSAPETVTAGARFTVRWENPVQPRDYVTVVPADTPRDEYADYIRVKDDRSGTLTAPGEPGAYEVRYQLQASGRAVSSAPVAVVEESVSLSAPDSVAAGADLAVRWDNSINPRDYVTIVPADAPDGEYDTYTRVKDHRRGKLRAPAEPGAYE